MQPQRAGELIIQAAIYALCFAGWYFTVMHVGVNWMVRYNGKVLYGLLYISTMSSLIVIILVLYTYLGFGISRNPQFFDAFEPANAIKPYECTPDGTLETCEKLKGSPCYGKYKPPRTHHCRACGICRNEWDHHCPWVGNCITLSDLKVFLLFLALTPITLLIGVLPILEPLLRHFHAAKSVAWTDPWIKHVWWDWLGSWIFFGGPLGRPVWGVALGYYVLMQESKERESYPGQAIEEPHLPFVLLIGAILLLAGFCFVLVLVNVRNVSIGQTSLDCYAPKSGSSTGKFVYDPSQRQVHIVRHNEHIYDLGWRENWRRFVARPWVLPNARTNAEFEWPDMNPMLLDRMSKSP